MIEALVPILRATVQAGVGAIVAYLLVIGIPVPPDAAGLLVLASTAVLTGLLAKGQQWVERRYPWIGALLGTPTYSPGLNKLRVVSRDLEREGDTDL